MQTRWILTVTVGLGLLFAVACGGGTPAAGTPSGSSPAPTAAAGQGATSAPTRAALDLPTIPPASLATPAPAAKVSPAPTSAGSQDTLSLDSRAAGLDKLKSYRIRWQSQWTTTDVTKTTTSNWDWLEEYSSSPEALHWSWRTTDAGSAAGSLEAWQIANTTYMLTSDKAGQASCTSFSSDDKSNPLSKGLFSPQTLGRLSSARFVGLETVNGVPSKHYQYDQTSMTLAGFGQVNGDIWVAVDGGYVVRDNMQWQGGAGFIGSTSTSKGNGKWTWDLTDANKPVAIKAPDNCGGAAGEIPLMPDAKGKVTAGDTIIYQTASTVDQVVAFYQKAMPSAGWTQEGKTTSNAGFSQMTFGKSGKKVQIMITSQGGQTNVVINAGT